MPFIITVKRPLIIQHLPDPKENGRINLTGISL